MVRASAEEVVPGATVEEIVARPSVQAVRSGPAVEHVVSAEPEEDVVPTEAADDVSPGCPTQELAARRADQRAAEAANPARQRLGEVALAGTNLTAWAARIFLCEPGDDGHASRRNRGNRRRDRQVCSPEYVGSTDERSIGSA